MHVEESPQLALICSQVYETVQTTVWKCIKEKKISAGLNAFWKEQVDGEMMKKINKGVITANKFSVGQGEMG